MDDRDYDRYPFFCPTQSSIPLLQERGSHVSVSKTQANCLPALQVSNTSGRNGKYDTLCPPLSIPSTPPPMFVLSWDWLITLCSQISLPILISFKDSAEGSWVSASSFPTLLSWSHMPALPFFKALLWSCHYHSPCLHLPRSVLLFWWLRAKIEVNLSWI